MDTRICTSPVIDIIPMLIRLARADIVGLERRLWAIEAEMAVMEMDGMSSAGMIADYGRLHDERVRLTERLHTAKDALCSICR